MRFLAKHPLLVFGLVAAFAAATYAAEPSKFAVDKLLTGLKNPTAVAVRPPIGSEPPEVFIAENGAGRVVKLSGADAKKGVDVIAGFPLPEKSSDSLRATGIQSLQFLDHSRLVVAGGNDDDKPFVRLYEVPDTNSPITAEHAKQDIDLPQGEANTFFGIARTQPNDRVGDNLLLAAWRGDQAAGLAYVPVRAGTLGETMQVRSRSAKQDVDAGPIAIASSGYVVVANRATTAADSPGYLAFFSPLERRAVFKVGISFRNIAALAYSPKSGNLYAANFQASDGTPAGIYRIDASNDKDSGSCTPVKIADIARPTALSFATDGTLYVVALGDAENQNAGLLMKITGDL